MKNATSFSKVSRQHKRASATDASTRADKRRKHVADKEESLTSEDEIVEKFGDEPAQERMSIDMVNTDLDQNQCCMCFRTYEEDIIETS